MGSAQPAVRLGCAAAGVAVRDELINSFPGGACAWGSQRPEPRPGTSDDCVEVWGGHWSSEVEALAGVGAEFGQVVVLCGCLDALGDDGQGSMESSCEAGYPL